MTKDSQLRNAGRSGWAALVAAIMCAYYWFYFLPPRLVGSNDPDRYYHLGLSRIISEHGFVRTLPQVEDLQWGLAFPDKEFLFHVLTGAADWLGGTSGVLLVVPILGIATTLTLYWTLAAVCKRWQAALFATLVPLSSPAFIFRLTELRPHVLAILFFCLLLFAVLRGRSKLAALSCAGFALSYHAFYIVLIVLVLAWLFKWRHESAGWKPCGLSLAGLALGMLANPYFPGNILMSLTHLQIALGINPPPGVEFGNEIKPITGGAFVSAYGYFFFVLILVGAQRWFRKAEGESARDLHFLFALALVLMLLSVKSTRASEYGVPTIVLVMGYFMRDARNRHALAALLIPLVLMQATLVTRYYREITTLPQGGNTSWYLNAIGTFPERTGGKVFTCQWDAGAYLLMARPDLRFVDILDPSFLWQVDRQKFVVRQRLIDGRSADPSGELRRVFNADYVLCGTPGLIIQMLQDPAHFRQLGWDESMGPVHTFEVVKP